MLPDTYTTLSLPEAKQAHLLENKSKFYDLDIKIYLMVLI